MIADDKLATRYNGAMLDKKVNSLRNALAGIAIAQFQAHFRHEQTPLMTPETIGALLKQRIVTFHGVFHDSIL